MNLVSIFQMYHVWGLRVHMICSRGCLLCSWQRERPRQRPAGATKAARFCVARQEEEGTR